MRMAVDAVKGQPSYLGFIPADQDNIAVHGASLCHDPDAGVGMLVILPQRGADARPTLMAQMHQAAVRIVLPCSAIQAHLRFQLAYCLVQVALGPELVPKKPTLHTRGSQLPQAADVSSVRARFIAHNFDPAYTKICNVIPPLYDHYRDSRDLSFPLA